MSARSQLSSAAREIANVAELNSIHWIKVNSSLEVDPTQTALDDLHLGMNHKITTGYRKRFSAGKKGLVLDIRIESNIPIVSMGDEEVEPRVVSSEGEPPAVANFNAILVASFFLPLEVEPSTAACSEFGGTNAVHVVWPFIREVSSTSLERIGLPRIILPLRAPLEAESAPTEG